MSIKLLIILSSAIFSGVMTFFIRNYAVRKNIIDIPNDRSSHSFPTPRGGGVAIATASLIGFILLSITTLCPWKTSASITAAGLAIAWIGFLDDKGQVRPTWRLLVHLLASAVIVVSAGYLPPIIFFGYPIEFGMLGIILAIISATWILNLFNFMDGIDGITSIEAITFFLVMGILLFPVASHLGMLCAVAAAATLGFLVWNFPPAKIFMGDAGSGFLGILIAAMVVLATHIDTHLLWSGLIILGVFVVDATWTLLKRLLLKKKVFSPHRSHAYQHMAIHYKSHKAVTLGTLAINALWLTPIAIAVSQGYIDGFGGLLMAYTPLIYIAFRWKAGVD